MHISRTIVPLHSHTVVLLVQGYSRKGAALCYLGRYADAKAAYAAGLEVEPNNEQLQQALQEVEQQEADGGADDIGNVFGQILRGTSGPS